MRTWNWATSMLVSLVTLSRRIEDVVVAEAVVAEALVAKAVVDGPTIEL